MGGWHVNAAALSGTTILNHAAFSLVNRKKKKKMFAIMYVALL